MDDRILTACHCSLGNAGELVHIDPGSILTGIDDEDQNIPVEPRPELPPLTMRAPRATGATGAKGTRRVRGHGEQEKQQ